MFDLTSNQRHSIALKYVYALQDEIMRVMTQSRKYNPAMTATQYVTEVKKNKWHYSWSEAFEALHSRSNEAKEYLSFLDGMIHSLSFLDNKLTKVETDLANKKIEQMYQDSLREVA